MRDFIIRMEISEEMLAVAKNALKGNPKFELEKADCLNLTKKLGGKYVRIICL